MRHTALLGQEGRRKYTEKEMKREISTKINKYNNKSRNIEKITEENVLNI
jgi:hypothetical protein